MASLILVILLFELPCLALVAAGTILMRNRRAKESHWIWVVGVILIALGGTAGLLVLIGSTLLMPV